MQLFYTTEVDDTSGSLPAHESKHAVRVLRKKQGDEIQVTDGKGALYFCRINDASPQKCTFTVTRVEQKERGRDYSLHIALSPTKSIDRYEWFLEKAVELGVDEITPVYTKNSERKRIKTERCERVIRSAAKQSLQLHFPVLRPECTLESFLDQNSEGAIAYCGDFDGKTLFSHWLLNGSDQKKHTLLIGPEGDFTHDEVSAAVAAGYSVVGLGNSRLRTETAGVYACSIAKVLQTLPT